MNPAEYDKFLQKGMKEEDPLRALLGLFPQFMTPIAHKMGERSVKIGKMIDLQIGAVALQHMEAAVADPEMAKEAIKLMREHLTRKSTQIAPDAL